MDLSPVPTVPTIPQTICITQGGGAGEFPVVSETDCRGCGGPPGFSSGPAIVNQAASQPDTISGTGHLIDCIGISFGCCQINGGITSYVGSMGNYNRVFNIPSDVSSVAINVVASSGQTIAMAFINGVSVGNGCSGVYDLNNPPTTGCLAGIGLHTGNNALMVTDQYFSGSGLPGCPGTTYSLCYSFTSSFPTATLTFTPTITGTLTPSATTTPTVSPTPTITQTDTPTISPTQTGTFTPSVSPTVSGTISSTPSVSETPSQTTTTSQSPSRTPTSTGTNTDTPIGTATNIFTNTDTPTFTPSPTFTSSPTPAGTMPTSTPTKCPTAQSTPCAQCLQDYEQRIVEIVLQSKAESRLIKPTCAAVCVELVETGPGYVLCVNRCVVGLEILDKANEVLEFKNATDTLRQCRSEHNCSCQ